MSTRYNYDAIVIGAGHNGMVCAAYLARARRRVLVVDAADAVGGALRPIDFNGLSVPFAAQLDYGLDRSLVDDLELSRHGFSYAVEDIGSSVFNRDGSRIDYAMSNDDTRSLAGVSKDDARQWPEFRQRLIRFSGIISDIARRSPPRLGGDSANARTWLAIALKLRRLGRSEMREFLRIGAINIFDVLEEQFENPTFKAAIAAEAVLGHHLAPRSPNSVLTLLMRLAGSQGKIALPRGGMSALGAALQSACESRGVTFRMNALVRRVVIDNDMARGVELDDGTIITAPTVISSTDPRTTCLNLVGADHLDTGFVRRVRNIRSNGCTARIDFLLDNLSGFAAASALGLKRRLIYAPDMDTIERAFNDSKYGRISAEPLVELVLPTMLDASDRESRQHLATALVQYVPYQMIGDINMARDTLLENTRNIAELMLPGFKSHITASRVLLPTDIEHGLGNHGGHWHHAEIALDQFFMLRPVPALAQYQLPVAGIWLCGAGCHPGGGISGVPGRNAAVRILASVSLR
ncbi:MAG: FAD-dependent oxidoreductase [marine bacterium B5-7]|nr:MAG: FAD-dependent oxidoreductase [marine bacterium B5-7]